MYIIVDLHIIYLSTLRYVFQNVLIKYFDKTSQHCMLIGQSLCNNTTIIMPALDQYFCCLWSKWKGHVLVRLGYIPVPGQTKKNTATIPFIVLLLSMTLFTVRMFGNSWKVFKMFYQRISSKHQNILNISVSPQNMYNIYISSKGFAHQTQTSKMFENIFVFARFLCIYQQTPLYIQCSQTGLANDLVAHMVEHVTFQIFIAMGSNPCQFWVFVCLFQMFIMLQLLFN